MARTFAPLTSEHWMVTEAKTCPGCGKPFAVGDVTTLIAIGPGDSEEARQAAREGRSYAAVALPVHAACATGEEHPHA